jgi:hypothetical protein
VALVANGVYNGGPDGAGGRGGVVNASLAVAAGSTLYVEVGGTPTTDASRCSQASRGPSLAIDCIGGWNGGADGGWGQSAGTPTAYERGYAGAGGGATDVRTESRAVAGSLTSRLVVAGGGGGGGGSVATSIAGVSTHNGGAGGGDADVAGADGTNAPGSGGHAGKASGDSKGGVSTLSNPGQDGLPGSGGAGARSLPLGEVARTSGGGGGGGGGFYGGGGGGPEMFSAVTEAFRFADSTPASDPENTGGGGGGGGSEANGKAVRSTPTSDAAEVTISWSEPGHQQPTAASTAPRPPAPGPATPVASPPGPTLASTGAPIAIAIAVGMVLLAGGAGVIFAGRRRVRHRA